jgi:predicted ester cyclase
MPPILPPSLDEEVTPILAPFTLLVFIPDGRYEVRSFATDQERSSVCAYGVFSGTHSGPGGPIPPTGKSTSTDYVYVMEFEDGKIRHMTKI